MKQQVFLFVLFILCLAGCKSPEAHRQVLQTVHKLDSLNENHQYFKLREALDTAELLPEKKKMILQAQVYSVFNKREASNEVIEEIFEIYGNKLEEQEKIALLETSVTNSLFLYDYNAALQTTERLLASDSLPDKKREEHQNNFIIYEELRQTPSQGIKLEKSSLPITKDAAGLSRIPIRINATEQKVVFDTGANFSVITDSLAIKAGVAIMDGSFKVKSITGAEIDSGIGVADSLKIGNSLLTNVVFLVFPEESLSFTKANYTIDAILGFPVINALKQIQIVRGKQFLIQTDPAGKVPQNMALDFLTPIVEVLQQGKSLAFTFDTGANSTALYEDYFELHQKELRETDMRDSLNIGGAGGAIKVAVFLDSFSGKIGESRFKLDSASVYETNLRDYPGIYGNIGQDIISQFDTLSLNFEAMWIRLH